jgi:cytochrome c oxidase cbb3-type subunit 1
MLYSRSLAVIGFWTFAIFAPWGGLYSGVPLPGWIISVSVAASVLTVVPLAATIFNLWLSRREAASDCSRIWFTTSLVFLAITGLMTPAIAFCPISAVTVVADAVQVISMYGFIGFALFGAIYYIAPSLFLGEIARAPRGKATWWCTMLGIILFSGSLLIGGFMQGHNLRDGSVPFVNIMNGLKPFIRISTAGLLLLLVGNLWIFGGVVQMLAACCRNCCCPAEPVVPGKLKPAKTR